MLWRDVFDYFLAKKIGVRAIPLFHVTAMTVLALRPASVYRADLLKGEAFGLIEEEFVAQASHG
eukprot:4486199-Ditylum_brightwellii.AAC.1